MIEFRPHHFLCTLGFVGKGYSDAFVRNFQSIADRLRAAGPVGDATPIRVTRKADAICGPCPNRRGEGCESQEKIDRLDANHAAMLGLEEGDVLTWSEAKARIAEKVTTEKFHKACEPCSWRSLGVCEAALDRLRAERSRAGTPLGLAIAAALAIAASPATAAPSKVALPKPAAPAAAQPEPSSLDSGTLSVELVRDRLFKTRKSKDARNLGLAWAALKKKDFAQARALAAGSLKSELFTDYALAITAAAARGEASDAAQKGSHKAAITSARKAIALLLRLEDGHPYSPFARKIGEEVAYAEIAAGDGHFGLGQNSLAIAAYERAFQRLTTAGALGALTPETLERYGQACRKKPGALCPAWIQRLIAFHPKGSEEYKVLAKLYPEVAARTRPSYASGKVSQQYKAPDLDLTAFENAMTVYVAGKYGEAIKAFNQFLDEFPRSAHRFRARYWLAQALTHEQEHEKAQKTYDELQKESPVSFYGLLSSLATGKEFDASIDATLPQASLSDPFLQPIEVHRLRRAERFVAEGARELALLELKDLRARSDLSSPFLMYLAMLNFEAGNFNSTFNLVAELIQRGYEGAYSSYSLRLIFPTVHMDVIQRNASQLKLDPVLVLSLIKQESAFDPMAGSQVGASGLMQLMHTTAVETEPTVRRADLTEPETNVRVGTKYLKKMLDRYNGNITLALAAYNAGPGAVDRWVRENRAKAGMLEFIEAIPYRETRDYVSQIVRNYFWYSRKLNGDVPKGISYFWNVYGPPGNAPETPSPPPPAPSLDNAPRETTSRR